MYLALRLGVLLAVAVIGLGAANVYTQSINRAGNGGNHSIRGRIYFPDGRPLDKSVVVTLQSTTHPEVTTFSDNNGAFGFGGLTAGTYTVVVDLGDTFEAKREPVFIEPEVKGASHVNPIPKVRNVQVFLRAKGSATGRPQVINAKLAAAPKAAADLYEKAQQAISKGDVANGIVHLRQAVGVYPEFSLAWNDLGVLLERSKDQKEAIEAFRTAVKYDPDSFAALLNLGSALAEAGKYSDAEKFLAIALSKNADSFRGHFYMGVTQTKLGRLDIAEQAFLQAIKIGGDQSSRAHYLLAGVYWAVKNYRRAADELEKYLSMEPKAPDAAKTRQSIQELRQKT